MRPEVGMETTAVHPPRQEEQHVQTEFAKYEGAGNDFILIDNREGLFTPRPELIARLCDRHFGIGADGLMTLAHNAEIDCSMRYYNADGSVEKKQTHQGKNDDSSWSRGQGWAVYGYTLCYRETKDSIFLNQAVNVADMIMKRNTPADLVPYWDFDAPVKDDTPRDASAAAVIASAFLELSGYAPDGQKYFDYAERILKSLSSDAYLAEKGKNGHFILMHSTGSLPHGSEIDTPLNYADYYYLEALKRYSDLKK